MLGKTSQRIWDKYSTGQELSNALPGPVFSCGRNGVGFSRSDKISFRGSPIVVRSACPDTGKILVSGSNGTYKCKGPEIF